MRSPKPEAGSWRKCVGFLLASCFWLLASGKEAHITLLGKDVAYFYSESPSRAPLLLLIAEAPAFDQWAPVAGSLHWPLVVAPLTPPASDFAAKALDAIIDDAAARTPIDLSRIYLVGDGSAASGVFTSISRLPDRFAAALAIGGSPKPAIDSNRFFAANAAATPVLWIFRDADRQTLEPLRIALTNAGCNLEARSATGVKTADALQWLAAKHRDLPPLKVDCETGSPAFGRCGWIDLTRLDPAQRNEVLPSTRIVPGSGAYLSLGGFGYDVNGPGPGLLVGWLPENYKGPIKIGDRIVSVAGRPIAQARDYVEFMDQVKEEKPAAIVVQRGKERIRMEAATRLPVRDEVFTARVQGEFLPAGHEIQIITRGVAELKVRVPKESVPARITWNGLDATKADAPGVWLLKWGAEKITAVPQ